MKARFMGATMMLVVATLLASSCNAVTHSSSTNAVAQPEGAPLLYGWDGVSGQILMSRLVKLGLGRPNLDASTWVFTGSRWATTQAIPAINAVASVLVYDSVRHREVLAVGKYPASDGSLAGTWEWDGRAWNRINTSHPLSYFSQNVAAAYSPDLRATVLIDTCSGGPERPPGETFTYDGADWRSITPAHWPGCPARLAYSSSRHSIVALSLDDYRTWRFDGGDWVPITPIGGVTPGVATGMGRQAPAVALDPKRDTWVVFGGSDGLTSFSDTWISNGTSWTKQLTAYSPIGRSGVPGRPYMDWDAKRGEVVLFGAHGGPSGPNFGDTWSWNGRRWTQLAGPTYYASSSPATASSRV
jgi:hypothetical protein